MTITEGNKEIHVNKMIKFKNQVYKVIKTQSTMVNKIRHKIKRFSK